ncbi:MAG: FAD-dependent oxidoreductase [Aestuariivirga sp.]|uniref:FAD-dependent oxidoreductase n=1 Tax=Aestuariivirga sp. TaxID=2650926 RepID=UPI0025BCF35A|nr:FAD-dependent oxidoreductase [Aestuariivirga sp.]MCA3561608.1 FAD-dependent oxidoreductase [Aestuariivirga sp.]
MKSHVEVAIIGGGVTGCSIAYHLMKAGFKDVLLIERAELTAGSTWHAAGGTGAFGGGANATYLHNYSFSIYPQLERETGQSCGFHHVGALALARTDERMDELQRHHMAARRAGLETGWLTIEETLKRCPILDPSTIKGVLDEPHFGHVDPSGVTQAFAKGARDMGAEIVRHNPVIDTRLRPDGSWDVVTKNGTIRADRVVNAAGLWAREVAAMAGIQLPLMPVEHHYFVTESIPEIESLDFELPLIGDADSEYYMRQEGKGLLLGVYEDPCTHWAEKGTPLNFGHELLPNQLERIDKNFLQAVEAVPVLGAAGVKRIINGPMIFSPDLNPLIGPYPGVPNYWCACGVMTGFSQSAAIGMVLAGWMKEREPLFDVFMWDVARYGRWAGKAYVKARTGDMYATRFKTLYPYEHRSAGRPVLTTPAYALYREKGAVFGASDGMEFPLWFAPSGTKPEESLTFRRPNWFEVVKGECLALQQGVGIIDISTYGKHVVKGAGARAWLDHVMANRMPTRDGQLVLTPMLSHTGHLMGEFSVAQLGKAEFLLIGSGVVDRYHHRWWEQFLPSHDVSVESMTSGLCGLSVSGPHARSLLSRLCDQDLSGDAWPYRRTGRVQMGPAAEAILLRVAYTGELGYEIYVRPESHLPLLEALIEAGKDLGVSLAGIRALNSLRIEKGYGAWGLEYALDYTPFESGMGALVKFDKPDFVGREAALKLRDRSKRYVYSLFEIDADDADPWGDEPILAGEEVVGFLSSAAYGFRVSRSLALGYMKGTHAGTAEPLSIDILGKRRSVRLLSAAAFDPTASRMKS